MKVVFTFLLVSGFALLSQQQRYQPLQNYGQALPPWNYRERPSIQDIYEYLYARSLLQELANQVPARVNAFSNSQEKTPYHLPDVLSRNTGALAVDEDVVKDGRFFFNFVTTVGSGNSYSYLKTIYYISTTVATTTLVSTCVPAASFDQTSYTVQCRRRREVLEMLLDGEESPEIVSEIMNDPDMLPSKVVPMEASAAAPLPRYLGDDAILVPVEVASSKTEDYLVEKGYITAADNLREKRFLIASTTITSYSFATVSSTKTLSNIKGTLSCLPSQFLLC